MIKKKDARKSFLALFNEGNYPQAFIVASKYPFLKKTKIYSELQHHFHSLLKIAALYIKQDQKQKAKELIGVYARVEEKRVVVKLLLEYGEAFLEFLSDISQQNIKKVYETTNLHTKFADVPSFVTFDTEIETKLDGIEAFINAMEFEKVDEVFLSLLLPFKKRAEILSDKLKKTKKLKELYEKELFWQCYDYIDRNDELQTTILAKLLENHFEKQLQKGKKLALQGKLEQIVNLFEPFLKSAAKQKSMEEIFAKASAKKIEQLIKNGDFLEAQKALFLAIERFGKTEELLKVVDLFFQKTGIKLVL